MGTQKRLDKSLRIAILGEAMMYCSFLAPFPGIGGAYLPWTRCRSATLCHPVFLPGSIPTISFETPFSGEFPKPHVAIITPHPLLGEDLAMDDRCALEPSRQKTFHRLSLFNYLIENHTPCRPMFYRTKLESYQG